MFKHIETRLCVCPTLDEFDCGGQIITSWKRKFWVETKLELKKLKSSLLEKELQIENAKNRRDLLALRFLENDKSDGNPENLIRSGETVIIPDTTEPEALDLFFQSQKKNSQVKKFQVD